MPNTLNTAKEDHHALSTRIVHAGLAAAICVQLLSSLVMHGPTETTPGDMIFQVHRYSGFVALAFALLFWITLTVRRRGTSPAALFPWFSRPRMRELLADASRHLKSAIAWRFPSYEEDGPLASAVHGLGLLLMTAMAVSGGIYAAQVWAGFQSPEPDGNLAMTVHFALANLVWAYLIAHAGMAALHHFACSASLSRMWRLRA